MGAGGSYPVAMPETRALDPASYFGGMGEKEAWARCVSVAYLYTLGGMDAVSLPYAVEYTYTHQYSDMIKKAYPEGKRYGNTWFYNK